jgi:hypothetical protein
MVDARFEPGATASDLPAVDATRAKDARPGGIDADVISLEAMLCIKRVHRFVRHRGGEFANGRVMLASLIAAASLCPNEHSSIGCY